MSSSVRGGFDVPAGAVAREVPAGFVVAVPAGADDEACALAVVVSSGAAEPAGDVNSIGAIVNACVGAASVLVDAAGAFTTAGALCVALHTKNATTQSTVAPPIPIMS